MYLENQPELSSDKGSNWSRGATRDICSPPLKGLLYITVKVIFTRCVFSCINQILLFSLYSLELLKMTS